MTRSTSYAGRAAGTAALTLLLALSHVRADEVIDRVMAVAAGEVVMASDVRAARELGLIDPGAAPDPDREILSRLIDRALMLDEVERYAPPEPDAALIDRTVSTVRGRFASDSAFERALARAGLDNRRLRDLVRQDLRIRSYLAQRFAADTPTELQTAVDEWLASLRRRSEIVDLYDTQPR